MNHLNEIENRDAKRDIATELLSAVDEMLFIQLKEVEILFQQ